MVLGLLIFSEHSLSLELNNCFGLKQKDENSFDDQKEMFETYKFTIDYESKIVTRLNIFTDARLSELKKDPDVDGSRLQKYNTKTYKITFVDDRVIKAMTLFLDVPPIRSFTEITLDIKKGIVYQRQFYKNTVTGKSFYSDLFESTRQCNTSSSSGQNLASSGSGFFINNKGYFITNNHVVDGCNQSKITFKDENYDAELIATDQSLDLALLKAKVKPKDFLNLSSDPPEKLQKIYVAGYPFGKGVSDDLKFTQGIISSVKGFADNSNQIQIDAAINSGNSGGPIVDEDGSLIAVAVSGLDKSQSEGIGFGIKANSVINFLEVNNVKYSTPGLLNFGMNSNKLNDLLEKSTVYTFCN